jgi:DNA-directed RNA polymerase subunit RPC12/RpoP
MGKASDWLREERRKVLGDWVAFCLGCGAARRWFDDFEADVPEECPQCGGKMLRRCPSCSAPFSSTFAVNCESCGAQLRAPELFGTKIRRG